MRLFKIILFVSMAVQVSGQTKFLTLNDGARLYIDESGIGQTLVFIPGWTMTHRFFENQQRHFSKDYQVLTYDPRGQGRSDQTAFKNTYKDHADDLRQILLQKDLTNVVMIGWSSGCLTVYEYIREFGHEDIAKVVLIDEPPKWVGDVKTEWVYGSFNDYRSSLRDLISGNSQPNGIIDWMLSKPVDSLTKQWMRQELLMTSHHVALSLYVDGLVSDYQQDLIRFSKEVPTLVMIRHNVFEQAESWLNRHVPGIWLSEISSHAMFWEQPTEFNYMLSKFLEESGK